MKIASIFLIILLLLSCSQSTEEKLKDAVLNNERKRIQANNEKIENISIDSIKYRATSEWALLKFHGVMYTSDKLLKAAKAAEIANYYLVNKKEYDSTQKAFKKEVEDEKHQHEEIERMISKADTSKSIYQIDYFLKAKTDKNSYENNRTIFLKINSLEEYKLPDFTKL